MNIKANILLLSFIICFTALAQNTMKVQSGATIKTTAGAIITLQDMNLDNDGTISQVAGEGGFRFSGTADNTIGGTSVPLFDILQIAKSGTAKISLLQSFDIISTIDFTSGLIDLNNKNIKLQPSALLNGESETSRIISAAGGYVEISAMLNNPNLANPGNLGATITSTANLGSTIIRRGHISETNSSGGGSSILRYYDLLPTFNTALDATLKFSYFDNELNGLAENILTLWKSSDNTHWTDQGFTTKSTINNYVEKSGIADFSRWTLSTVGNPLPVNFIFFTVDCYNNMPLLTWKTAQEQNSHYFEIQKSEDGTRFTTITIIPASGNSSIEKTYTYTDNAASALTKYYRVAEIDIDGRKQFTSIDRNACNPAAGQIRYYPNPVQQLLFVDINATVNSAAAIKIYDSKGAMALTKSTTLQRGNNHINIDMEHFAKGNYLLQVSWGNGQFSKTIKLLKQ
jgi:hypothetical protein